MRIHYLLLNLCVCVLPCYRGVTQVIPPHSIQGPPLLSGMPVRNGNVAGTGNFALPSYHVYNMGTADVNGDGNSDLFIESNKGTYLYYFRNYSKTGVPVFSSGTELDLPAKITFKNRGVIFQNDQNKIFAFWEKGRSICYAELDRKTLKFSGLKEYHVQGLPRDFSDFGIISPSKSRLIFLFSAREKGVFSDGLPYPHVIAYTPEGFWPYPIPGSGIYGALTDDLNNQTQTLYAKKFTPLNEVLYSYTGFAQCNIQGIQYILSGTRMGNIVCYRLDTVKHTLSHKLHVVSSDSILQRNPNVNPFVAYFKGEDDHEGIITVGEGGIYYYQNERRTDSHGNLIFGDPVWVRQENPDLFGGSLVVPELADWDGDGKTDIISGTSMGYIYFFKNTGTNERPAFQDPVLVKAGGHPIHVQPGYREDIQGPGEGRWGYTCPTVVDWNGDGLPDILTGDSRGKFMVYLNKGTARQPDLALPHTLYLKGLDMYGAWRVKPGVGTMGGRMAYICLDKDDDFHLYWKLDNYNLEDGGKLTIGDSMYIHGTRQVAGTVGRAKIELTDWDGDGVKDMLVGTYRKQSIPEPKDGLPYHSKPNGSAVLFLKNTGTEARPVFAYPKMLRYKGKYILLGGHSCSPTTGALGTGAKPNLIVGAETGVYMFYNKKDISW